MSREHSLSWPSTDPRQRRAFAHASIAFAKANPGSKNIDQAKQAIADAGNSKKTSASGFDLAFEKLSSLGLEVNLSRFKNVSVIDLKTANEEYTTWRADGSPVRLPEDISALPYLDDMLAESTEPVDIHVINRYQVLPASLYRSAGTQMHPEADVRIVVVPNFRIPTGGIVSGRRVIVYHFQ